MLDGGHQCRVVVILMVLEDIQGSNLCYKFLEVLRSHTHVLFVCTYVIASSVGCALDLLSSLMYNCEHTQHGIYFCCCLQSLICLGFGLGFSV